MSASTIGIDNPTYPIPTPVTIPEINGRTAMTTRAGIPAFASSKETSFERFAEVISAEKTRIPITTAMRSIVEFVRLCLNIQAPPEAFMRYHEPIRSPI